MRRKTLNNAKLIIKVIGDKATKRIETVSVYDNRIGEYLGDEYIRDRGIKSFLNVEDLKETLNWNLNGDSSKYQFKWGQRDKNFVEDVAYIFQ